MSEARERLIDAAGYHAGMGAGEAAIALGCFLRRPDDLLAVLVEEGVLSAVSYLRDDGVAVPIYRRTEGRTR